jgi:hypothetical protein
MATVNTCEFLTSFDFVLNPHYLLDRKMNNFGACVIIRVLIRTRGTPILRFTLLRRYTELLLSVYLLFAGTI